MFRVSHQASSSWQKAARRFAFVSHSRPGVEVAAHLLDIVLVQRTVCAMQTPTCAFKPQLIRLQQRRVAVHLAKGELRCQRIVFVAHGYRNSEAPP
jgi:hypothetical protein